MGSQVIIDIFKIFWQEKLKFSGRCCGANLVFTPQELRQQRIVELAK